MHREVDRGVEHYPMPRYLTSTPILPHLRCGGIDAAPHPHSSYWKKEVPNEAQGDELSGDASSSL